MKNILIATLLFLPMSASASTFSDDVWDIRRMIATSLMRQQGRNLLGTDKDFPGQRPPVSDDLVRDYCLPSESPYYKN